MRATLIVLVALLAACGGRQAPQGQPASPPAQLRAPALDGGEIDTRRYRGQTVVIHLFSPSEPHAAGDAQQLTALHEEAGDELTIIGVALEPSGYPVVAAWRRGMEAYYLIALVTEASEIDSANIGPLEALPTTVVLDARGRVTHRVEGPLEPGQLAEIVGRRPGRAR